MLNLLFYLYLPISACCIAIGKRFLLGCEVRLFPFFLIQLVRCFSNLYETVGSVSTLKCTQGRNYSSGGAPRLPRRLAAPQFADKSAGWMGKRAFCKKHDPVSSGADPHDPITRRMHFPVRTTHRDAWLLSKQNVTPLSLVRHEPVSRTP